MHSYKLNSKENLNKQRKKLNQSVLMRPFNSSLIRSFFFFSNWSSWLVSILQSLEESLASLTVSTALSFVLLGVSGDLLLDDGSLDVSQSADLLLGVSTRAQPTENGLVLQWVLALALDLRGLLSWVQNGLDLVGVDDTGDIGVGHHGPWESVALLFSGATLVGSEDLS